MYSVETEFNKILHVYRDEVTSIVNEHGFIWDSPSGVEYLSKGLKNTDYPNGYDMMGYTKMEAHNEVSAGYWYNAYDLRRACTEEEHSVLCRETMGSILELNLHNLKEWLLSERLSNYGYGTKEFASLVNKASYYRKKLKNKLKTDINVDGPLFQRIGAHYKHVLYLGVSSLIVPNAKFNYIVGQSFNEEYIRLLKEVTK